MKEEIKLLWRWVIGVKPRYAGKVEVFLVNLFRFGGPKLLGRGYALVISSEEWDKTRRSYETGLAGEPTPAGSGSFIGEDAGERTTNEQPEQVQKTVADSGENVLKN